MNRNELISILIVDDHELFREGLKNVLTKQLTPNLDFIVEAKNGIEAETICATRHPDIVLMDVHMPKKDGIATTRDIIRNYPQIGIIGLSTYSSPGIVTDMVNAGARGYLLKDVSREELIKAIKSVHVGKQYFTSQVADFIAPECLVAAAQSNMGLSTREKEILQLICEGKTNKAIAEQLSISKRTVDGHREKMMVKLNLSTTIDLFTYAVQKGIHRVFNGT